jgi:hypothetical protein
MTPRTKLLVCAIALMASCGGGCANTEFRKAQSPDVNGIRYYRPATYILVKPDYEKQQASVTFWTGPDTSVTYAADPSATCAVNNTELKLNKGMLSEVTVEADSTKLASETVKALGEVAKSVLQLAAKAAAVAALESEKPAGGQPAPIYLFVVAADGSFKQIYGPAVDAPAAPAPSRGPAGGG